jgi:hypothetical protein
MLWEREALNGVPGYRTNRSPKFPTTKMSMSDQAPVCSAHSSVYRMGKGLHGKQQEMKSETSDPYRQMGEKNTPTTPS